MSVVKEVEKLKNKHSATWQDRSEQYWLMGLLEEVVELIGSLLGLHRGPVEWELKQIAAICMNWIELRRKAKKRELSFGAAYFHKNGDYYKDRELWGSTEDEPPFVFTEEKRR